MINYCWIFHLRQVVKNLCELLTDVLLNKQAEPFRNFGDTHIALPRQEHSGLAYRGQTSGQRMSSQKHQTQTTKAANGKLISTFPLK